MLKFQICNRTYTLTTLTKDQPLNHSSVLCSVGISRTQMDLYCFGYHSCISVYATSDLFQCSTKPLFYTNCPIWPSEETWHYRSGVNQMVLLKNSNDTSMNIDLLAHELTLVSWWDPCFFFLATIPRSKLTFNEFGYHTD